MRVVAEKSDGHLEREIVKMAVQRLERVSKERIWADVGHLLEAVLWVGEEMVQDRELAET